MLILGGARGAARRFFDEVGGAGLTKVPRAGIAGRPCSSDEEAKNVLADLGRHAIGYYEKSMTCERL